MERVAQCLAWCKHFRMEVMRTLWGVVACLQVREQTPWPGTFRKADPWDTGSVKLLKSNQLSIPSTYSLGPLWQGAGCGHSSLFQKHFLSSPREGDGRDTSCVPSFSWAQEVTKHNLFPFVIRFRWLFLKSNENMGVKAESQMACL